MYHRFNVEVATRYGVPCALVLGHIDYLVEKAKTDGEKKRNGKYWASKSVKKIAHLYPYYTENTIRRAIEKLRQGGGAETPSALNVLHDVSVWLQRFIQFKEQRHGGAFLDGDPMAFQTWFQNFRYNLRLQRRDDEQFREHVFSY